MPEPTIPVVRGSRDPRMAYWCHECQDETPADWEHVDADDLPPEMLDIAWCDEHLPDNAVEVDSGSNGDGS